LTGSTPSVSSRSCISCVMFRRYPR
jgi:hypothetical protein